MNYRSSPLQLSLTLTLKSLTTDWHILGKNLNILHTFGEYAAKLQNIKDFQSSLGVFGDTYTVTTSTFCPFTGHFAAQTSPHESEAGNLNVFAMFYLASFMRR
jgi:hypothetical protein